MASDQAAAVMMKGLTALMLLKETYKVKRGEFVLIQDALERS